MHTGYHRVCFAYECFYLCGLKYCVEIRRGGRWVKLAAILISLQNFLKLYYVELCWRYKHIIPFFIIIYFHVPVVFLFSVLGIQGGGLFISKCSSVKNIQMQITEEVEGCLNAVELVQLNNGNTVVAYIIPTLRN